MILWIKAFHLIAMVAWFSGIFYLPRLFVYHSMPENQATHQTFKTMERRLCYGIMTPSALLTLFFGFWLLYDYAWAAYRHSGWLHAKLFLVAVLAIYHLYCIFLVQQFQHNQNRHSPTFYRWLNEFPVLILVGSICLAVLKPF